MWVTTTEQEFDTAERESWDALAEYELALCPDCHNLIALCSDPDGIEGLGYYPQRRICWITAAREVAERRFKKLHQKEQPDAFGYLETDGVAIWASAQDLTPNDRFLDDPNRWPDDPIPH